MIHGIKIGAGLLACLFVTTTAQAVLVTHYNFYGNTPFTDIASGGAVADNLVSALTSGGVAATVISDGGGGLKGPSHVLDLTADNNAMVSPSSADTTMSGSFSIAFWGKYAVEISAQNSNGTIINKRNDSNPNAIPDDSSNYWMGQGTIGTSGNDSFRISFDDSVTGNNVVIYQHAQTLYDELQWHHYAMTFDTNANIGRFYLDGAQIGGDITVTNEPVTDTSAQFIIGRRGQSAADFNGWVDDIRLYNNAISASEVAALLQPDENFTGNFDGMNGVDIADFTILRNNFLTGTTFAQGDATGNGIVDHDDFYIWRTQYLMAGGSLDAISFAVPEPSAIVCLLTCCLIGVLLRRV